MNAKWPLCCRSCAEAGWAACIWTLYNVGYDSDVFHSEDSGLHCHPQYENDTMERDTARDLTHTYCKPSWPLSGTKTLKTMCIKFQHAVLRYNSCFNTGQWCQNIVILLEFSVICTCLSPLTTICAFLTWLSEIFKNIQSITMLSDIQTQKTVKRQTQILQQKKKKDEYFFLELILDQMLFLRYSWLAFLS